MPSKKRQPEQKPASRKPLAMPHEDDASEVDEFETERRQRGMYNDSDEDSLDEQSESGEEDSEEEDDSEAESSAMARRRWQGWEKDELDGQEEEFTEDSGDGEEDSDGESEGNVPRKRPTKSDQERIASLRKELEQVPLAHLLKAQRKLSTKQSRGSDSESDSGPETASSTGAANKNRLETIKRQLLLLQQKKGKALDVAVPRVQEDFEAESGEEGDARDGGEGSRNNLWQVRKERKEDRAKEREQEERRAAEKEKRKRDNKHAPMVMSAKRPITRRRQVVELEKTERRDPRFGSLSAGTQDPNLTAQSYSFVSGMMSEEYHNMRSALKLALKRERSAPRAEQDQRRQEREEVEMHLHKARSRLERYEREQREKKVLQEVKREEKAKQAEGKGEWHMKRADKKDLLLKARFQALEKEGGKRKVKKAIEKKQKKIAGKEKKSRPFARGQGGAGGGAGGGGDGGGDRKRRRVG